MSHPLTLKNGARVHTVPFAGTEAVTRTHRSERCSGSISDNE